MPNFLEDILTAAGGEEIIAFKFLDGRAYNSPTPFGGKVVPFSEVIGELNYDYDDGYGGQDCHNIYAWTPTRILYVGEYDGSTWIDSKPRNPE